MPYMKNSSLTEYQFAFFDSETLRASRKTFLKGIIFFFCARCAIAQSIATPALYLP